MNWYKKAQFRHHRFLYTIKKYERPHHGETKKTELHYTDRGIYTISDVQRAIDKDLSINHQDAPIIRKKWMDMNNEQYFVEFNTSEVGQTQDIIYLITKHALPAEGY